MSKLSQPRLSRLKALSVATIIGVALSSAPAMAQNDDTADGSARSGNPEIVVTAQFREQKLQDTPLSITAIDSSLLEARNQDDLEAVAKQAPNVTLNSMGSAYGASLGASIRGIGQFDFNPAYEPGVGLYIDDVYYPTLTGANFDLLDLERVEILRGPQGTLTGRNSIGGAIKLISKKPDGVTSGFVHASYGSRDYLEIRAGANFPLTDSLFVRLSGVHKEQGGYVDQVDYGCANPGNPEGIAARGGRPGDCVVDDLGNVNYSGARIALRYDDGGPLEVMVIADYINEKRNSAAEVISLTTPAAANFLCGAFCTYADWNLDAGGQIGNWNPGNDMSFKGWGVSGHIDYELTDSLAIQSVTAYREYRNKWGTDDDFTPDPSRAAGGFNDLDFWFVSQELRLNGQIGDNIEFTVGGFYSDQRSTYYTRQDIRYIAPGLFFQFDGNDPINADSIAAFGTVILRPTDNFTLTGGIRYTSEHKDYTFVRKNYDGTVSTFLGALDGLTATYDGNRFDWRVSADYRFSDAVLAYVTIGTGFKGGGVTARPFDAAQALNGSFGPETVVAYEAGLKTDLFGRLLRLNASAFINKYQDIQLPLITCASLGSNAPCGARQNAGDGDIKGFELELMSEPIEGLMIDGSLSYIDGDFTRIDPRVGNAILSTDPLATPKWKWSFGIQYKADLGTNGSITPRFDISHTGRISAGRISAGAPIDYFDSYELGNAKLTWRNADEDLAVSLEVKNLFDQYYSPFRFSAVYAFSGTAYNQVGRPREWALTVRKEF